MAVISLFMKYLTLLQNKSVRWALVLLLSAAYPSLVQGSQDEKTTAIDGLNRLTLDQCVKLAVANSHQLMAERHRLAALEAQVNQAFWAQFSGFEISGFASMVPDKKVDMEHLENYGAVREPGGGTSAEEDLSGPWGPTLQVGIKGGVPVYTFGKISSAKEAVKNAHLAKKAQYPSFEHQIRYQVEQAYQAVWGAREMLYTISQGRGYLEKARKKVEGDLEEQTGSSTQIDLLKLKIFSSEIDHIEAQTVQIERVGLAALRFLVGGGKRQQIDIVDEPQQRTAQELDELNKYKKTAIAHRPEIKALRYAIKALEAKVELRRAEFWPNLLVVGGAGKAWTPGRPKLNNWALRDNYNYGWGFFFGLALDYPLDFGLDRYRLDESKAELAALTVDQKAALEGILLEVEEIYHRVAAARDGLAALARSRRLVKGWIAAELQNQATGLSSAKDVKDAIKESFQVLASIHRLTHDYNVGMAELKRATGVIGNNRMIK